MQTDATERRKCRNERKLTICTKAHELVQKCGLSSLELPVYQCCV